MTDPALLVAHDSEAMRAEIRRALAYRPERLLEATSGDEALHLLVREHPRVLVVDVALPGREPFVLCEDIVQAGLRTLVVLVASVYDHTRYKRRPTSLHGAHDYVEQHHIHDMLPGKVDRLLGRDPGPWQPTPEDSDPARRLRAAGQALLTIRFETQDEGRRQASRLAELLVADLALYAPDLPPTLASGTIVPEGLSQDLDEARRILAERVPAEILDRRDWIGEAFARYLGHRSGLRRSSVRVDPCGGRGPGGEGLGTRARERR